MSNLYSFKILTTIDELESHQMALEELEGSNPDSELFTSFHWLMTWLSVYDKHTFIILLVYKKNEPVAFIPLLRSSHTHLKLQAKALELVSINSHGNIVNLPIGEDPQKIWREVFQYLHEKVRDWDYIYLEGILEDDPVITAIEQGAQYNKMPMYTGDLFQVFVDWLLPLGQDWDEYYRSLSKNVKKSLNNRRNQMRKNGGFEVKHFSHDFDFSAVWETIKAVDANSWQYAHGSGISSPQHEKFYYTLGQLFLGNGLDIWILYHGESAIAFEFSIIYKNRIYGLRWGFDQNFASYSPGKVLRADSLKYYFGSDLKDYCMMGKYEEFKKMWNAQPRKATDILIFNRTPLARLHNFLGFKLKTHYLKIKFTGLS